MLFPRATVGDAVGMPFSGVGARTERVSMPMSGRLRPVAAGFDSGVPLLDVLRSMRRAFRGAEGVDGNSSVSETETTIISVLSGDFSVALVGELLVVGELRPALRGWRKGLLSGLGWNCCRGKSWNSPCAVAMLVKSIRRNNRDER